MPVEAAHVGPPPQQRKADQKLTDTVFVQVEVPLTHTLYV
jgi:hypothetical protein